MPTSIVIGSDHKGFELKNKIIEILNGYGCIVNDVGTDSKMPCSYPEFANMAVENILNGRNNFAILIDETGTGMSLVCNRTRGVRACVVRDADDAAKSKQYYDCNVLCLGSNHVSIDALEEIIAVWLEEEFTGGRHANALSMFD